MAWTPPSADWAGTPYDFSMNLTGVRPGGFTGLDVGTNDQISDSMNPQGMRGQINPRWQFSNTPNARISKWAPMGWGQWPGITGGPDWARAGAYGGAPPQQGWSAPNGVNAGGGGGYGNGNPFGPATPAAGGTGGVVNPIHFGPGASGSAGGGSSGAPTQSDPATDGFSHPSAGPNGTTGWQALVTKLYGGSDPIAAMQKAMGTVSTQLGFGGPGGGPSTMTQANLSSLNGIRANLVANGMDAYTAAKLAEAFGSRGQGALTAAQALGIGNEYNSRGGLFAPQSMTSRK